MTTSTLSEVRIDLTPPHADAQKVATLIAPYAEMLGSVPGGLQMFGASPALLEHYVGTLNYYMTHPRLGQNLLSFIRYLVSWRGDCAYCVDLNEALLLGAGFDLETIRATRKVPALAPLTDKEKALMQVALDAVDQPEAVTAGRIDALRELGWTDRDILDAVWHATLNRAFGRTAEVFGLPSDGYAV